MRTFTKILDTIIILGGASYLCWMILFQELLGPVNFDNPPAFFLIGFCGISVSNMLEKLCN